MNQIMNIRTNNIYISSQLHRWLKWLADMETPGETEKPFMATQDSMAEKIMREYILNKYPAIQQLEAEYWTARSKLDEETVNKLKQQTNESGTTGTNSRTN